MDENGILILGLCVFGDCDKLMLDIMWNVFFKEEL